MLSRCCFRIVRQYFRQYFMSGILQNSNSGENWAFCRAVPRLSCRCLCLITARQGLVLCGGGSGFVPPGPPFPPSLCLSSSVTSVTESVRGTILSCLDLSICLSGCCLEDTTCPLDWDSAGASEMAVDLSVSRSVALMSQVLLPSESSISAPMQLYTMLTRSVDCMETKGDGEVSNQTRWRSNITSHINVWDMISSAPWDFDDLLNQQRWDWSLWLKCRILVNSIMSEIKLSLISPQIPSRISERPSSLLWEAEGFGCLSARVLLLKRFK